jgi:hypothetical protein
MRLCPFTCFFVAMVTTSAATPPLTLLSFVSGKEKNVLCYTVQCLSSFFSCDAVSTAVVYSGCER